ncbi:hypothetical protein [Chroococcidiopsis sp.]|uniref:hypothetical protein n=1 Tax=Chroococcidiopsis sp. TaxID=3088168 RepID=UPI003F3C02C3
MSGLSSFDLQELTEIEKYVRFQLKVIQATKYIAQDSADNPALIERYTKQILEDVLEAIDLKQEDA